MRICNDLDLRTLAEDERDRFITLAPDLLCIANSNGHFQRLNPAFTALLGYSETELLSSPFSDFVHPDRPCSNAGKVR